MSFIAEIDIMPLKELLDPAGKAVIGGLDKLGITGIDDVRIGKHVRLTINAADEASAKAIAEDAVKKLLANAVMEQATIRIVNP
ncbi:MAG: phosphoribosylformylglycinamidine synthase subunit PurS [Chitinophagaceae bacterium]|nr:phosphoribosylformylglycinamidine synthase subunit PurS [Chitinophagaceae bacterium]MCW5913144.1 phosphoribosylformylglycinamidine synthase subunit PurS [Chitinophagaceae bacterium]MCZ2396943.1 phosphoribosylformylglycinamidine synthase subunit PurS [Chitinophagales bacterium]